MKKITIGNKFEFDNFDFRETFFGICEKEDRILLTKNSKKNEIAIVGGGVEKNESYEQCLKREFFEESGCEITKIKELCTIDCFWLAGGSRPMESLANIFIVEIADISNSPSEEGCEILWVPINETLDILPLPYQKEAIRQYLKCK